MSFRAQIEFMRDAMLVRRFHQHFTHEIDTVGKHSAGVALFVNLVDPTARKEVIMAALSHDLGELVLGDVPAPTKKQLPPDARAALDHIEERALESAGYHFHNLLTDSEERLLKICDYLDGFSFVIEERRRGNLMLRKVGDTYSSYLMEYIGRTESDPWYRNAVAIATTITNQWSIINNER